MGWDREGMSERERRRRAIRRPAVVGQREGAAQAQAEVETNSGAEAEAEGGDAAGAQPAGEAEERAGGPQQDTRTQTGVIEGCFINIGRFF